ncbi:hypothetical protein ACLOJK_010993 [Asimina triloba]
MDGQPLVAGVDRGGGGSRCLDAADLPCLATVVRSSLADLQVVVAASLGRRREEEDPFTCCHSASRHRKLACEHRAAAVVPPRCPLVGSGRRWVAD